MESNAKEILRARARSLAQVTSSAAVLETVIDLLVFRLGSERYAVESQFAGEVHPLKEMTPLPCAPPFVAGIVNVRGRIVPVVDLKKLLELPEEGLTDLHCIITVQGDDFEIGLLADVVVGVCSIPAEPLQPALATLTGVRSEFLKGVTAERLVVLDLSRILSDPRIIVHEEVEA